jgi:hypothetical protein
VFWGIGVVGFFGLALVVPVYTSCVPRGALRFFYKSSSYLSKKKYTKFEITMLFSSPALSDHP